MISHFRSTKLTWFVRKINQVPVSALMCCQSTWPSYNSCPKPTEVTVCLSCVPLVLSEEQLLLAEVCLVSCDQIFWILCGYLSHSLKTDLAAPLSGSVPACCSLRARWRQLVDCDHTVTTCWLAVIQHSAGGIRFIAVQCSLFQLVLLIFYEPKCSFGS